jgi:hypothetical protein
MPWLLDFEDLWWLPLAECAGQPLEVFFPRAGDSTFAKARAICRRCEVLAECRAAIDHAEKGQPLTELHGLFAESRQDNERSDEPWSRIWSRASRSGLVLTGPTTSADLRKRETSDGLGRLRTCVSTLSRWRHGFKSRWDYE